MRAFSLFFILYSSVPNVMQGSSKVERGICGIKPYVAVSVVPETGTKENHSINERTDERMENSDQPATPGGWAGKTRVYVEQRRRRGSPAAVR